MRRLPASRVAVALLVAAPGVRAAVVDVDTTQVRYQVVGLGGTYRQIFNNASFHNDPVGEYTLANLPVQFDRAELALQLWAPDANWRSYDADTAGSGIRNSFLMMQDLASRGIPIVLSVWRVADWLVDNPGDSTGRHIPSDLYGEAIDAVTSYLARARDAYGVEPVSFSFNEADIGYMVSFLPSEIGTFIRQGGAAFSAAGLQTKFLAGDTANPTGYSYIGEVLDDLNAHGGLNYVNSVSFHTWGWYTNAEYVDCFSRIAAIGDQYGLPVLVGEVGTDPSDGLDTSTWAWAWDHAKLYQNLFTYAKAAVTVHWTFQNYDPIVDAATLTPFPVFYVVKHFLDNIPPGSNSVSCPSDDVDLWVSGFTNVDQDLFVVEMLNVGSEAKTVTLNGLPSTSLSWRRTSNSAEHYALVEQLSPAGGSATITVPAESLNTLVGDLAGSVGVRPSRPTGLQVR